MRYLLIVAIAWAVAQGCKHLFRLLGRNRRVFNNNPRSPLLLSGGMPSAHSASVAALLVAIGYYEGLDSAIFALAVAFGSIVIYDAVMVRYSSGNQGDTLNQIIKTDYPKLKPLKIAHGHTILEAVAGALTGMVVAAVVIFATK